MKSSTKNLRDINQAASQATLPQDSNEDGLLATKSCNQSTCKLGCCDWLGGLTKSGTASCVSGEGIYAGSALGGLHVTAFKTSSVCKDFVFVSP